MNSKRLKFEDFETEKLSKKQQKIVKGGDDSDSEIEIKDPVRGGGGGTGTL